MTGLVLLLAWIMSQAQAQNQGTAFFRFKILFSKEHDVHNRYWLETSKPTELNYNCI